MYDSHEESEGTQKEIHQECREEILCEGEKLKNCYLFHYLGIVFVADGSDEPDVCRRIGIAKARDGQLCHVLGSVHIPHTNGNECELVQCGCGLFVYIRIYGCEGWELSPQSTDTVSAEWCQQ